MRTFGHSQHQVFRCTCCAYCVSVRACVCVCVSMNAHLCQVSCVHASAYVAWELLGSLQQRKVEREQGRGGGGRVGRRRELPQPIQQRLRLLLAPWHRQRLRLLLAPWQRACSPSFKTFLIIKSLKNIAFENFSACCENMSFWSSSRSVMRNNYRQSSCSQNGTFRRCENTTVHIIYNYVGVQIILSWARIVIVVEVKLNCSLYLDYSKC